MSDLTDFLLARIAEDESANRATPEPESWCDRAEGLHLDYRRSAAECEAKRRIVEWCADPRASEWHEGPILQLLTLPYVDHPEYRDRWRL